MNVTQLNRDYSHFQLSSCKEVAQPYIHWNLQDVVVLIKAVLVADISTAIGSRWASSESPEASAETSVTDNSLSLGYNHVDDQPPIPTSTSRLKTIYINGTSIQQTSWGLREGNSSANKEAKGNFKTQTRPAAENKTLRTFGQ